MIVVIVVVAIEVLRFLVFTTIFMFVSFTVVILVTIFWYFRGLSECNSGAFDRIVSTYTELASHEKVLDDLISLLRKGQVCFTIKIFTVIV